jgi:type II secretory pathway pseudopilin PulG
MQFTQKAQFVFGSLLLAVILLTALFFGSSSGKAEAQAESVYTAAQNVYAALQNFHSDQDRYPTASEFSDQNTMLNYLTAFPLPNIPDKNCSQSFVYKRLSTDSFQLNFCLAAGTKKYSKGWNALNGQPGTTP